MTPVVHTHKSARFIGALTFKNGNQTRLWVGSNRNTGSTIVFQQTLYKGASQWERQTRTTGRRIAPLMSELDHVLNEGEATWSTPPDPVGFDILINLRDA